MKVLALVLAFILQAVASPIAQQPEATNATISEIPMFQDTPDGDFEVKIDGNGRSRVLLCSNSNRGGTCINWGQKNHCCTSSNPAW
jgi:hypothetical protein